MDFSGEVWYNENMNINQHLNIPKDVINSKLQNGWNDASSGHTHSASEVFSEIERRHAQNEDLRRSYL